MSITCRPFGKTAAGEAVHEYTITNASGASASILDFGGTVTRIVVPDRNGKLDDVNLSYDDVAHYESDNSGSMGGLIGRYGNRIGGASFELEGQTYTLAQNNGQNCLHGGRVGYNRRMWTAQPVEPDTLRLTLVSPDGEEGFPGTVQITVDYTFDHTNTLGIHYHAVTNKPTLLNLTNHSYFNLNGHSGPTIHNHELHIAADFITETDNSLIPTGRLIPSDSTVYGFTTPTKIRDVLAHNDTDPTLKNAGGVDFNYCAGRDRQTKTIASLYSPLTGRVMDVITDQPGVQCYMAQFLQNTGKDGAVYGAFQAVCLETQHYPDSIHQPHFPSVVVRPQDVYDTFTLYRFSVR